MAVDPERGSAARYYPDVPAAPRDLLAVLAECGRLVARGGDLGVRLDGLAEQAARAAGAATSVIYLLDGDAALLLAGGTWGLGPGAISTLEPLAVGDGGDDDAVGRAVRARRAALVAVTPAMTTNLPTAGADDRGPGPRAPRDRGGRRDPAGGRPPDRRLHDRARSTPRSPSPPWAPSATWPRR